MNLLYTSLWYMFEVQDSLLEFEIVDLIWIQCLIPFERPCLHFVPWIKGCCLYFIPTKALAKIIQNRPYQSGGSELIHWLTPFRFLFYNDVHMFFILLSSIQQQGTCFGFVEFESASLMQSEIEVLTFLFYILRHLIFCYLVYWGLTF